MKLKMNGNTSTRHHYKKRCLQDSPTAMSGGIIQTGLPREADPMDGWAKGRPLREKNLAATSPNTEQFEPTEASPVRHRQRMAGDAS